MGYTREEGELHSLMLQSARTAVVVSTGSPAWSRIGRRKSPAAGALAALPLELLVSRGKSS